jgi:Sigma-70, region 4
VGTMVFEDLLNFDFQNSSTEERLNWVLRLVPLVKKWVNVVEKTNIPKQMVCEDCQRKQKCDEQNKGKYDISCPLLEPAIPHRNEGANNREKKAGSLISAFRDDNTDFAESPDMPDILKSTLKTRSDEIFTLYTNCTHLFTEKQASVVYLRIKHGMKYKEIGKALNIKPSTASDRFRRAKKQMEAFYREK